ncbi:MAG TPA: hypothetical protein VNE61_11915 [Ktedonobacteraceae bacterium]|nr:hypothetical protein [Ktedonobacteraceae bacterium]
MWIVARYQAAALFSLKAASATASGGKTLLIPTPYAIKMALLDAAIRTMGVSEGERLFPFLRDLAVWMQPPDDLVVIKGFGKIRRLLKDKSNEEKAREAQARGHWPMQPTIAYREYVYYRDPFHLAFSLAGNEAQARTLQRLLLCINYFGRRGGFMQILEPPALVEQVTEQAFIHLTPEGIENFYADGTLQVLDDCGPTLTFQKANIYNAERITPGKERLFRHVVLPYRLTRSSRGYSHYQRIMEET